MKTISFFYFKKKQKKRPSIIRSFLFSTSLL